MSNDDTNILRGFNYLCPICHGKGLFDPYQFSDNPHAWNIPAILCPACEQLQRSQNAIIGLLRILNYGIGQPNQQIIRQFHHEIIEIARATLEGLGGIPDTFPNLQRKD